MSPRIPPPDRDLVERREILNESGITRALQRMAFELIERSAAPEEGIYLVGIRTGGAYLANRLATLVSAVLDVFTEAQHMAAAAQKRYPYMEE